MSPGNLLEIIPADLLDTVFVFVFVFVCPAIAVTVQMGGIYHIVILYNIVI